MNTAVARCREGELNADNHVRHGGKQPDKAGSVPTYDSPVKALLHRGTNSVSINTSVSATRLFRAQNELNAENGRTQMSISPRPRAIAAEGQCDKGVFWPHSRIQTVLSRALQHIGRDDVALEPVSTMCVRARQVCCSSRNVNNDKSEPVLYKKVFQFYLRVFTTFVYSNS